MSEFKVPKFNDADTITEGMDISPERTEILKEISSSNATKLVQEGNLNTKSIIEVFIAPCENVNELVYQAYLAGRTVAELEDSNSPLGMLLRLRQLVTDKEKELSSDKPKQV